ncbi:tail fiber domain-containing protein [Citrobacter sp. CK204]|uniref:tail fiber domain-containing protein n=1 Tax=Citrobacter sp. CK204 TaxID=2985113 RepID=UPI0025778F74|nr:tail fiber domain-containing protein [Citrobacter sp. CK204]MDM3128725.1 tail fiber domain-containing protein [Citrobacter sp. CK204]
MSKSVINANVLNLKDGVVYPDPIHGGEHPDNASLQLDAEQVLMAIRRLEARTKIMQFSSVEALGLHSSTVTLDDLYKKIQVNSVMMITVVGGSHPNLETPKNAAGVSQSGTLLIDGNNIAYARIGLSFYNEFGLWRRYYNTSYSTGNVLRDSGWLWVSCQGAQVEIDNNAATYLGGKLSNLLPGEYFVSGTVLNSFTDSPYSAFGLPNIATHIDVKRMIRDRGVMITTRANNNVQTGFRMFVSSSGSIGPWIEEFVSGGTPLSTTGTIDFAGGTVSGHLSPNTPATKNLGGATLAWNNLYVQNAPVVISDREAKMKTSSIPDDVLDAWATVEYSQWKLKAAVAEKGEASARFHVGIIAQEIKEKFELAGLDATQYGILIHEKWDAAEASPASYDEDGNLVSEEVLAKDSGEIWMVRMEECLALEAALMRRNQRVLDERIKAIKNI